LHLVSGYVVTAIALTQLWRHSKRCGSHGADRPARPPPPSPSPPPLHTYLTR